MIDGLLSRQVTSQNKTKSQRIFFCMHPAFQICNFSLNYLIFPEYCLVILNVIGQGQYVH